MEKLQKLCFAEIASSFERFHYVYTSSNNGNLQGGLHILRKFYSLDIAQRLWEENLLEEKYAEFIFNKYLKSVDTAWFSKFSSKTIIEIFKTIGPSLQEFDFSEFCRKNMQWVDVICHLPNVKVLTCKYCNNNILECIAEYCPKLETLDIKFSRDVTDDGLRYFYQVRKLNKTEKLEECLDQKEKEDMPCPLLKKIKVRATSVGDKGVEQLVKNLPCLKKIVYDRLPIVLHKIHKEYLDSPDKEGRYNLTYLNLLRCIDFAHTEYYDEILEACVTLCPNLKSLFCPIFKLKHVHLCSTLPDVENLHLRCVRNSIVEVNDFLKQSGEKLTHLMLQNCTLSLSSLGHHFLRLTKLNIRSGTIRCNENGFIPMFSNLKMFAVDEVELSDSGNCKAICRILRSSPVLESLYLMNCRTIPLQIKTEILKCCDLCTLKYLYLDGSVEVQFLKDILISCSTLKILDLEDSSAVAPDLLRLAMSIPNRPDIRSHLSL